MPMVKLGEVAKSKETCKGDKGDLPIVAQAS